MSISGKTEINIINYNIILAETYDFKVVLNIINGKFVSFNTYSEITNDIDDRYSDGTTFYVDIMMDYIFSII